MSVEQTRGKSYRLQWLCLSSFSLVIVICCAVIQDNGSSTMRFIHINEYEYMNNYAQYIILHTRIRIQ